MTAPSDEPFAFHVGFVVHDLQAVADRYQQLLGIPRWHTWDGGSAEAPMRIAYGRAAELTVELIQVLGGDSVWADHLRRHGEGIQHIGFWVPDVHRAVADAVARGATITLAMLRDDGTGIVQLRPGSAAETVARVAPRGLAYVDAGMGGVQFEFVGWAMREQLQIRIGEDFANVVMMPAELQNLPAS